MEGQKMVTIVGAGLSGLSAAITLARKGIGSFLISLFMASHPFSHYQITL